MNTEDSNTILEKQMIGINEVFYYLHNYKIISYQNIAYLPDVLVKADFPCDRDYIVQKFLSYEEPITNGLMILYGDIDNACRKAMLSWILTNYKSGVKF